MTNNEQWKKDADQLKKDLDNRQKVIKKREVDITFGPQSKKKSTSQKTSPPSKNTPANDAFLRQQLGL